MDNQNESKLSLLFISLLSRAGVLNDLPSGTIGEISTALDKVPISNETYLKVLENISTIDEARKNPELFRYFTSQAENDFNSQLNGFIGEYNFDAGTIAKITSAPSPARKAQEFAAAVKLNSTPNYANLERKLDDALSGKKPAVAGLNEAFDKSLADIESARLLNEQAVKADEAMFGW